ncbi:MAG: arylesterase [Gammaproteobacteria bacterium]|nr:arylesterase [Gammaproteobacteria bacterium]
MGQFFKIFTLYCISTVGLLWAPTAFSKEQTLLVIGDSLSAGYGMSLEQAWPALLQDKLDASGSSDQWRVINASVSGETTQGGVRRLPALLNQFQPQWVLLELGANDGLRGYPIANITANLGQIIVQSQAAGAKVAVLGIQLPPNYGARYTAPFFAQYAALAKQYKIALVPFILENVAVDSELMQGDGLHPTKAAQPVIVDNVWQHLSEYWLP